MKEQTLNSNNPQAKLREMIKNAGRFRHIFEFYGVKYEIRSLTPRDEIYIFDRASAEAKSELSRISLIRIYSAALMIHSIEDIVIDDLLFKQRLDTYNDSNRDVICNLLGTLFGIDWDRRVFRIFFKYCWSWAETQAAKIVKEKGVESFLTPEELEIYNQYRISEEIENNNNQLLTNAKLEASISNITEEDATKLTPPDIQG